MSMNMAHSRCFANTSPARALHRVLISDSIYGSRSAPNSNNAQANSYYLFPPRLFSSLSPSRRLLLNRHAIISAPTLSASSHIRGAAAFSTTPSLGMQRIQALKHRVINHKIMYEWVRIASAPPESTLSEPRLRDDVLAELNLDTHTLLMVASPPLPKVAEEEIGEDDPNWSPPAAICRIIDNEAAMRMEAEIREHRRRREINTKELEFSWSISTNDMAHKLRRMREFLDRGFHVEVMLAKKRKGRQATQEEAEAVLASVREAASEVEGAKETRKMDGDVGGIARLYFEGISLKTRKKQLEDEKERLKAEAAKMFMDKFKQAQKKLNEN